MRLFAALAVPTAVVDTLDAVVAPLRAEHPELGWTTPEGWHLTLAFLGEVAEPVDAVTAALTPVAASAPPEIRLSLTAGGHFGRRALWVGVRDDPPGAMRELGDRAQEALAVAGLPVDRKEVRPHLTIARARGVRRGHDRRPDSGATTGGAVVARLARALPTVEAGWIVRDLVVYRSVRSGGRQSNRYEPVVRLPLGDAAGS